MQHNPQFPPFGGAEHSTGTWSPTPAPPEQLTPADHTRGSTPTPATARTTMNGKPVLHRDGKTVLTDPSEEFHEKLLCDGVIINLGDACVFICFYCYCKAAMLKIDKPIIDAHNHETGQDLGYQDVVIRRSNALEILKSQLLNADGSPTYPDPTDTGVVYSSTLVDVAGNMELLRETADGLNLVLEHTNRQVRLLSKSSLLMLLVQREMIPKKWHHRLILGFSIGTLDDKLAAAIERGTALVSKRIEALHWLQDHGIRTFGMICPSLPQEDYEKFSREICAAIRVERCEHVWAEVLNVRGESLTLTTEALRAAGLEAEALRLESVSGAANKKAWDEYARQTFLAHTRNIPADKLRFLQYITAESADWWKEHRDKGAVLLGKEAKKRLLTAYGESAPLVPLPRLDEADINYRDSREKVISGAVAASIEAAKALYEIKTYRNGLIWRTGFLSFDQYCEAKWGIKKSHAYRQVEAGSFIADLANSPQGENAKPPVNAGQVRQLLEAVPVPHRVECWNSIMKDKDPAEFTGSMIADEARKFARKNKLVVKTEKPARLPAKVRATRELGKLKSMLAKLPQPGRFDQLLLGIGILIDQDPQEPDGGLETVPPASDHSRASGSMRIDPEQVAEAMDAVGSIDDLPGSTGQIAVMDVVR